MGPLVLAIEPDLHQAAIVKRIVREKVLADVTVVDSRENALEAMRSAMPDVLLVSALLSPRDEDELIAHLRTLEAAEHLQTHTIPQLASSIGPDAEDEPRGLLSAFRRKKKATSTAGCDPDLFAEEIRAFLQRAADKKRELKEAREATQQEGYVAPSRPVVASVQAPLDTAAESTSSWASPFEWKPASARTVAIPEPEPSAPVIEPPVQAVAPPAPIVPSTSRVRAQRLPPGASLVRPRLRILDSGLRMLASGSQPQPQDWRFPEFRVRIRRVRVRAASPADESEVPETVLSSHGKPSDRDGERTRALA